MSLANTPTTTVDNPGLVGEPSVVSLRSLRRVYAIIPVAVLVVGIDVVILGGVLRDSLESTPQGYLFLSLIFGTPHIVASNVILFTNRDYFVHYRITLLKISAAIGLFFLVFGLWLPYEIMFGLIAAWTVTHVVKQQLGIGNIVAHSSGAAYRLWGISGIGAGVCFYLAIFLQNLLTDSTVSLLTALAALLASITAACSVLLWSQCETSEGRRWIVANGATMVGSALMFLAGYPFFAVLIPRFVHDITAFAFYVTHDRNRAVAGQPSWLSRRAGSVNRGWIVALPIAAIALSAALEHGADSLVNGALDVAFGVRVDRPVSLGVVGFLALLHYAFESFTWKGSSPYRQFVHLRTD